LIFQPSTKLLGKVPLEKEKQRSRLYIYYFIKPGVDVERRILFIEPLDSKKTASMPGGQLMGRNILDSRNKAYPIFLLPDLDKNNLLKEKEKK
jgi:hypothetical protein